MRLDDLRAQLKEMAARAPRAAADPQATVVGRGRRIVRRRRIVQSASAVAAVVVIAGGIALLQSGGSHPRTVVTQSPTSHPSTSVTPTTRARTTVPPPTVTPTVPQTSPTVTPTTPPPTSTRSPVPADAGYTFTSTPVVNGNSVYVIETRIGSTDSRVVRIDLQSRTIVATATQPGAASLVLAMGRVWVGVGSGSGGPFGVPPITSVVTLDPQTLEPRGTLTTAVPKPGAYALTTGGGFVWALSGSAAIRMTAGSDGHLDTTGASVVPLALPASNPYRTLAVSDDGAHLYVGWATAREREGVTEYEATTGAQLHENANVGGGPSNVGPALTFAGTRVWATFPTGTEASAVALQATDLTVTGDGVSGPNSMSIAPYGDHMWVSRSATLDCVDFHDTTLASHDVAGGVYAAAAPTAADVYVSTGLGLAVLPGAGACN